MVALGKYFPSSRGVACVNTATHTTPRPQDKYSVNGHLSHLNSLNQVRLQVEVRVPRLIMFLRTIRYSTRADVALLTETVQLARDLMRLKHDQAEQELESNISTEDTQDPVQSLITPRSFMFLDGQQHTTAVLYWMQRLIVINAVLQLGTLITSFDEDILGLHSLQRELVNKILAASQWSQRQPLYVSVHTVVAGIVVYSALLQNQKLDNLRYISLKDWLLLRIRHPLLEWTLNATQQTVEHAASVLLGGELF
jgi:hypothetical protein